MLAAALEDQSQQVERRDRAVVSEAFAVAGQADRVGLTAVLGDVQITAVRLRRDRPSVVGREAVDASWRGNSRIDQNTRKTRLLTVRRGAGSTSSG